MATVSNNALHNRHSDLSSDQAAALRDIARNGSADEGSLYGFNDGGHHGQPNGPSNSFQDLEDPAALLESLANFEHAQSSNEANTTVSNDHFASLLQAAATATGEEAAQTGQDQDRRGAIRSTTPEQFASPQSPPSSDARRKRKRHEREDQSFGFITNKAPRRSSPDDEEQRLAREREIWGPEYTEEDTPATFEYQHTALAGADARAAGVHSAAALFRRPSTASKKYTRPPMSKLFTSLELTPEQFLYLQAAAKSYMLDEKYPERSECVGNKARGDTDMIKLRLFGCVKSFLEDEGWGERCFGENALGADQRKLKWPQMKNKVISLVTPLMRRMVTNERQRKYAMESRKNLAATKAGRKQHDQGCATPMGGARQPDSQSSTLSAPAIVDIDPKLNQYHYSIESPPPQEQQQDVVTASRTVVKSVLAKKAAEGEGLKYLVSIMYEGHRVTPRFTLTPSTCPGFSSLAQHIHSILDDDGRNVTGIKILSPGGLVDVNDEGTWTEAIELVKQNEWMDGECRCVVQVE